MSREDCVRDAWIGVATAVAGAVYLLLIAGQVSAETDGEQGVSGRTLPHVVGWLIVALGALLAAASGWRARSARRSGSVLITGAALRRVVIYIGVIALYAWGIATIGYVVSTAAALLFAMLFSGARNRLALLLMTALTPLLMYGLFHRLMQIPLPEALLF